MYISLPVLFIIIMAITNPSWVESMVRGWLIIGAVLLALAAMAAVIVGLVMGFFASPDVFLGCTFVAIVVGLFFLNRYENKQKAANAQYEEFKARVEAERQAYDDNSPTARGMRAVRENQAARFIGPLNRPVTSEEK